MVTQLPSAEQLQPAKRGGRRGLGLMLFLLIAVTAFAGYMSPVFRLQTVEVVGLDRLTRDRVMEAGGLAPGTPRWELTAEAVEARLQQEPWVKSARAEWQWSHLQIALEERTPVSLLPYHGKWVSLDDTGLILELVESPAQQRLPVISGVVTTKAIRGTQLTHAGLSDALLVLSWMAEALRNRVAQVEVAADRNLTLFMVGGGTVQWGQVPDDKGRLEAVKEKLERFGLVWQQVPPGKRAKCRIDLRVAGRADLSGCN